MTAYTDRLCFRRTTVLDFGHIAQQHRLSLTQLHDRIPNRPNAIWDSVGVHVGIKAAADETSRRKQCIGLGHRTGDVR